MKYGLSDFNRERRDPESGRFHSGNGYRTYNPGIMRFHVPDSLSPFGAGGINSYAYCAGDPVNRADPSGHFSVGQWIGMAIGLVAGMALSILTEGAAMPAVLSLMATVSGDAVIGAGSELIKDATDRQGVNWGQMGIAAGLSAVATLGGYGLGMAGKLKGTASRPFGGLMMEGVVVQSGQFRNARFLGINVRENSVRWNVSFEDTVPLGRRLTVMMDSHFERDQYWPVNEILEDGAWQRKVYSPFQFRNEILGGGLGHDVFRLAIPNSLAKISVRQRHFVSRLLRLLPAGKAVVGFEDPPAAGGPVAAILDGTMNVINNCMTLYRPLNDFGYLDAWGGANDIIADISAQFGNMAGALTFENIGCIYPTYFRDETIYSAANWF